MTKIQITTSLFNYKQIFQSLAEKGRQLFGQHFKIYQEDLSVFIPIIAWMIRDEDVARQFDIDLHKGIFLGGPIGAGKTHIMQLMRCIVPAPLNYELHHCDRITTEYTKRGPAVLDKYDHRCWCFDDMGLEEPAHHYKNSCLVMKSILFRRYELFTQYGTMTHITSTLSTTAIENKYGKEVRSRMREMLNRIVFTGETKDKR